MKNKKNAIKKKAKKPTKKATTKKAKSTKDVDPNFRVILTNKQVSKDGLCEMLFEFDSKNSIEEVSSLVAQAMAVNSKLKEFIGSSFAYFAAIEIENRKKIKPKSAISKVIKRKK